MKDSRLIGILVAVASLLLVGSDGVSQSGAPPNPGRVRELIQAPFPGEPSSFTINARNRIEYHARDQDVRDVFEQLALASQRNIVVAQDVTATYSGDLFNVDFEEAVDMICRASGLIYKKSEGYLYVSTPLLDTRVFVLSHVRAADVLTLVQPFLVDVESVTASTQSKRGVNNEDLGNDSGGDDYAAAEVLVARAFPDTMTRIERLLATVDARPKQVLMEATILSAELSEGMDFGIQLDSLGGVDFRDLGTSSPDGQSITSPAIGSGQLDQGVVVGNTNTLNNLSSVGLNLGIINGDVAAFLRALRSITNTTIMANTSIMTLNKQLGEVLLGRRDGYITTTVGETTATQQIEFIETGTRLVYRPFIGDDGLIRLEVHPEDSEGGVNEQGLPFKETAEVTTNILLRDGDTVVIGGLFRTRVVTSESKVPLAGDLPFVGSLFRGNREETLREEIIILLTPRILDLSESDAAASASQGPRQIASYQRAARRQYLEASRLRLSENNPASAWALFDAATEGRQGLLESADLRHAIGRALVPPLAGAAVDQRILNDLLGEIGAENP